MHKIDSDGATVDNLFTEGNASLSIPATVVSAEIANAWQEEIVNVVEEVGIPLLTSGTDTYDQLVAAIKELIERGGRAAPVSQALDNNAGPLDVTDFPTFDSAEVKSLVFVFDIFRRTDSQNVKETGKLYLNYNSEAAGAENDKWDISFDSKFDDAGVTFSVALDAGTVSKLQYTTNDLTGTTYQGTLRITDIVKVRV
jgi:hypothetical protein